MKKILIIAAFMVGGFFVNNSKSGTICYTNDFGIQVCCTTSSGSCNWGDANYADPRYIFPQ